MVFVFRLDHTIEFFALSSPVIIASYLVLHSFFDQNFKGLIYLAGLMLTAGLSVAIKGMMPSKPWFPEERSPLCSLLDNSIRIDGLKSTPDLHSTLLMFTFIYLALPLLIRGTYSEYLPLIITMVIVVAMNAMIKKKLKCTKLSDIIVGWFVGGLLGFVYYTLISAMDNKVVYFSPTDSNAQKCGIKGPSRFVCTTRAPPSSA
jgi:membrane-associated phospholipid phosphatase